MRRVVVNSTPLIALCKTGHLSLLRDLYEEITIPEAVFREVTVKNDVVKAELLKNAAWVHVRPVSSERDKRMYKARLHDGEVEVMILAQELQADLVILDDLAARKTAEYLGLPITGTIGVLLRAKEKGFISLLMPLISEMERNGIYYGQSLKEWIKKLSGE